MIPTMLLVGLVVGRWWVIPLGALGWAVLLLATGPLGAARSWPRGRWAPRTPPSGCWFAASARARYDGR